MEPYYYTKMSKPQQAVYYAIYQGLMALSDSFQVPKLEGRELSDVFFQLRLDHPEIFWAEGFHYRYYQDSANITFLPEYIFEKGKIKEHQKALKARVEKLVRPAMKLSEWEKEKYVHDFICENVRYDKLKKPYSHEIIGPLGQGVGVCEGIAKAVKVLLDALGVWCVIAICGNNPEKELNTVIPGTLSGSAVHIIIWIQHLIIHLERVIKSKISVMITLIWMTNRFSKIMSH